MSLPTTKATTATATHAVVQAVETYIQNQNLLGEIAELDELLHDLIDLHKDNEVALKRVVQCIYNLLQNNSKYNVKFGPKVFHKLISVAIADSEDEAGAHGLRSQLVANVLLCVQIHVRKFPRIDGKFLLPQLWLLSLSNDRQPHAAQILVQMFDDFVRELGEECVCSTELHVVLQSLLESAVREHRKSAYFLMKKLLVVMQGAEGLGARLLDTLKCNEQHWSAYVCIMESLEEQQSHLVLPTLKTLLPRIAASNPDDVWLSWLRILYVRLLQDNNILVLRWTLTYFLTHFDLAKLCRANVLVEFLAATNRTQLYNVESAFLPEFNVEKFMPHGKSEDCLKALVTLQWHSVPLVFWLRHMQPENAGAAGKNVLLQLSSRVRTLRNPELRRVAKDRVFYLFEDTINAITLGDYLVFIETLFNANDDYNDYGRFITKMRNCEDIGEQMVHFNKRCYEIIIDSLCMDEAVNIYRNEAVTEVVTDVVTELIRILGKLPSARHGWWRLFPLFLQYPNELKVQQICLNFYSCHYNVNIEILEKELNLAVVQQHLLQQLNCRTKEEKCFVLEKCVDWFVAAKLKRWSQMEELNLKPIDLLERGTTLTFVHLAELLRGVEARLEDNDNVLLTCIALLKKHPNLKVAILRIVTYAAKCLSDAEYKKLVADIFDISESTTMVLLNCLNAIPNSVLVQGILKGETTTGDARIEASFIDNISQRIFADISKRDSYINMCSNKLLEVQVSAICSELLRINNKLTEKKPRYFENCKEHRIKIRIARALLIMRNKLVWSDELWTALLATNDQLNISYIYECLVAWLIPSLGLLLERMQTVETLKPSQQVSIISVVHIYCMRNWDLLKSEHLQEIVSLLLPHTMGAHFQTRLLAQLVLHRLAVKCEESSFNLPVVKELKICIEKTLGNKLLELKKESRFILPEIMSVPKGQADCILYMTNTPFDEYDHYFIAKLLDNSNLKGELEFSRNAFKSRKNLQASASEAPVEIVNLNVQRKMNPINDIYLDGSFVISEQHSKEQELIVVASLIDKLPNLGGLARTCEVLGVKTLILSSKSIAEKSDFTNLSMTAEKTLNIVEVKPAALAEFLIEKQYMGYKIVGAEQTAHSVSFEEYKFPEKCILLLG